MYTSCVNVIPDSQTSKRLWEDCRASCNLLQGFPFLMLENSSQCPSWILLMELQAILGTGNGFSFFCSSLMYVWQDINSALFPTPAPFTIYWIFPSRLCFENLFSFSPLLFFMASELKFGHKSTTSLIYQLLTVGDALLCLENCFIYVPQYHIYLLSSKQHDTVNMAFEAL